MGYDIRFMGYDSNDNPIIEKYGSTLNEASAINYKQTLQSGLIKNVSVQNKLQEVDKVIGKEYIISDDSNAWENRSYTKGETCVCEGQVYECLITNSNKPTQSNVGEWKVLTISEIENEVNTLNSNLKNNYRTLNGSALTEFYNGISNNVTSNNLQVNLTQNAWTSIGTTTLKPKVTIKFPVINGGSGAYLTFGSLSTNGDISIFGTSTISGVYIAFNITYNYVN